MKEAISKIPFNITIGFMYWLNETHNLRGLKDNNGTIPIEDYPHKLKLLKEEYDNKYPNGLIGWNVENDREVHPDSSYGQWMKRFNKE